MRVIVLAVALLCGCASTQQMEFARQEYAAYTDYLNAEITAGRMTFEQGKYLQLQKQNEIAQRLQADRAAREAATMNALGAAAAINQASQPYQLPSNTLNCTTFQRGPYGQIQCR